MSSLAGVSLERILLRFSENYENLFTPRGGYLVFLAGGGWGVQKIEPRDLKGYYESLVETLIRDKEYRAIAKPIFFVKRINCFFTSRLPFSKTAKKTAIFFNSKIANYSYLSNFFTTLVLCEDPVEPSLLTLYPSSENAYQAYKIAHLAKLERKEDVLASLKRIEESSPLESKREGAEFYIPPTDIAARKKVQIMKGIVKKKFDQNPILAASLGATRGCHLIEESGDCFWGSSKPADYKELESSYRLPISLLSRNCLGRILMGVRDEMSL